jgi:hypothetical protein
MNILTPKTATTIPAQTITTTARSRPPNACGPATMALAAMSIPPTTRIQPQTVLDLL